MVESKEKCCNGMSKIISFIIPAFNAASTVVRCLDSVYRLPIEEADFEVIVIDDCSSDSTVDCVKEFALRHNNLVLLCQRENHRQGAARNRGVEMAQGKYIVFIDSDDESAEGVINAVRLAEKYELEMVSMRVIRIVDEGEVSEEEKRLPFKSDEIFTGIEMQTEFPFWCTAPWPYIYLKSFLNEVNYPFAEDVLFEDSDFVNVHLFHAKRMSYCDECGYVMHFNATSTTHTLSYKHLCDYALLGTRMLRFYETLDEKTSKYAKGILEGGSFNIMKSFGRLYRLNSISGIRAFYDRFDSRETRKTLLVYREPSYCWTRRTRFCIRHRELATVMMSVFGKFLQVCQQQ